MPLEFLELMSKFMSGVRDEQRDVLGFCYAKILSALSHLSAW